MLLSPRKPLGHAPPALLEACPHPSPLGTGTPARPGVGRALFLPPPHATTQAQHHFYLCFWTPFWGRTDSQLWSPPGLPGRLKTLTLRVPGSFLTTQQWPVAGEAHLAAAPKSGLPPHLTCAIFSSLDFTSASSSWAS